MMSRWPDEEQKRDRTNRFSAAMVAPFRWPSTLLAIFALVLYAYGLIYGGDKFWPPSAVAQFVVYTLGSATLSWTGWYDLRDREKRGDIAEDPQHYHFWTWRGTPRWLVVVQVVLIVMALAFLLRQPAMRWVVLAFIGFMALTFGYDYNNWRIRHTNERNKP